MTVVLNLSPDIEKELKARANERGMSLDEYIQEVVIKDAKGSTERPSPAQPQNLHELLVNSPLYGAELDLERIREYPRKVDIE
ncbi:MAG TPA: hypothetical protein VIY69_15380 [Candidatus Acidoferrales bacterium]